MKVYIAAGYKSTDEVLVARWRLEMAGIRTLAGWMFEQPNEDPSAAAARDLAEIDEADYVLLLADTASTTGGMHFEAGYAFANDKLMVIGDSKNIFYSLPAMQRFDSVAAFIEWYKEAISE